MRECDETGLFGLSVSPTNHTGTGGFVDVPVGSHGQALPDEGEHGQDSGIRTFSVNGKITLVVNWLGLSLVADGGDTRKKGKKPEPGVVREKRQ
jgi:hypothetical protein